MGYYSIVVCQKIEAKITLFFCSRIISLRGRRLKGKGKGVLGKGVLGAFCVSRFSLSLPF